MKRGKLMLKGMPKERDPTTRAEHMFERWLWSELVRLKYWIFAGALPFTVLIAIALYSLS